MTPQYFTAGRLTFNLPLQIGDIALNNADLSPSKTTIKNITTIASGEKVPGYAGGPYHFKNGHAYILHLSTGTKVLYAGNDIA